MLPGDDQEKGFGWEGESCNSLCSFMLERHFWCGQNRACLNHFYIAHGLWTQGAMKYFRLLSRARLWQWHRCVFSTTSSSKETLKRKEEFTSKLATGPQLKDFLVNNKPAETVSSTDDEDPPPYIIPSYSPSRNNKSMYAALHTCSISCKEKAEQTIWNRLQQLAALKRKRSKTSRMRIGLLGCMAERLKQEILDKENLVDLVAGPDAYRDLPRLLSVAETGQQVANVLLSVDETYADILPVHTSASSKSAFVSIMRGCDNMCTYCIVPFTRGRERSRPLQSILEEVRMLSSQGVKEVTLLGQNVNSYRDTSSAQFPNAESPPLSRGFSTIYKHKKGGLRFVDLLDKVSQIDPEMRIRFTSPHPKDFPDEVLQLIAERHNICKQIHIPAQSGSNKVLETMRRGYSREVYLDLIQNIQESIPGVSLSSDFITGFCEETEEDHLQTLSLLRTVSYNAAFLFAYSMRKKTRAYHRLQDDVPQEVKQRRLAELIAVFREEAGRVNQRAVGSTQLVLVEGPSKRSPEELCGRNDGNTKVIFSEAPKVGGLAQENSLQNRIQSGDYVLVKITSSSSQSLKGTLLGLTTLQKSPAYS
uniref:Mitochondrial tRNA methylthiotransferase CDK5RAP1 n=1 Tax=Xenopus tropicalis TaxID=8364 RepID=A0A6I8RD02_XENTR